MRVGGDDLDAFGFNRAVHELLHPLGLQVVDLDRDPLAARSVDELGGFLDGLRAVVLGASLPRRAPRALDGRALLPERNRDAAPGPAGRARDQRDPAVKPSAHVLPPSSARLPSARSHKPRAGAANGFLTLC